MSSAVLLWVILFLLDVDFFCVDGNHRQRRPAMSIEFDRKSAVYEVVYEEVGHSVLYVNVTCYVKTDDISSAVTLGYIGPHHSEVEVVQTETRSHDGEQRYLITMRQLMRLPSEGYVICSAMDDVSGHEITEAISSLSTGCPDSVKVKLTQEKLAERPTDVVKLSCEIIGVLQNQTGHFWWLLDESSHLLYMFSEKYNIDRIRNTSLVVQHQLEKLSHGFISHLWMNVDISQFISVRVQTSMKDGTLCKETIPVRYKEPHIALTHTDLLMRGDLVKVDCTVHEPAGEPFFLLQYQRTGSKNMSISNEWASVRNLWTYHRWIYTTVLQVPDEGVIICHVTDMFGRNTVQKSIHIANKPPQQSLQKSFDYRLITVLMGMISLFPSIGCWLAALYYCRKAARPSQLKSSHKPRSL